MQFFVHMHCCNEVIGRAVYCILVFGTMDAKDAKRRRCSDAVELVRLQNELKYWEMHFAHEKLVLEHKKSERDAERAAERAAEKSAEKEPEKGRKDWKAEDMQEVDADIHTLDELLAFAEKLDMSMHYSFDKQRLKRIVPALRRLKEYVGQESVKNDIAQQVLYFLQSTQLDAPNHTVIVGPSGTGKTMLAGILADIYHGLELVQYTRPPPSPIKNFLEVPKKPEPIMNELTGKPSDYPLVVGNRANMVGMYTGHTVARTQKLINRALGGVLLIDEAYELGQKDSFSQECIDTLNRNLSEQGRKFICIILGYADKIDAQLFDANEGMRRRFPYRYTVQPYSPEQLRDIFLQKLKALGVGCQVSPTDLAAFFQDKTFEHFGGDMETLATHCVKKNARRLFGKIAFRPSIELCDLHEGYATYKQNKKDTPTPQFNSMYA